jgi:hypothetical protein
MKAYRTKSDRKAIGWKAPLKYSYCLMVGHALRLILRTQPRSVTRLRETQ